MRRAGVFLLLILLSRSAAVRRLTVWLAVWREGRAGFNVHVRGAVGGAGEGLKSIPVSTACRSRPLPPSRAPVGASKTGTSVFAPARARG